MLPVILALIVLLVCGFLVAWPRKSKGCLVELLRPVGGLVGAAGPVAVLWLSGAPDGLPGYGAAAAAFVLNISAVTLAATGWQAALHGRKGEMDEAMVDTMMNPFVALAQPTGSSTSGDDVIGGCLLAILMMAVNVLIVAGLLIANILKRLLPAPGSPLRRLARVVLGLAYAVLVFAGGALIWLAVNG